MKRIKTWQEAFEKKGIDPNFMPSTSMIPERYRKPQEAIYKLHIVSEVLNDGWEPDYTNHAQRKYFPYFVVDENTENPSGFGLSLFGVGDWRSGTGVGSRLCFKDYETAQYAALKFKELYEDMYLIK